MSHRVQTQAIHLARAIAMQVHLSSSFFILNVSIFLQVRLGFEFCGHDWKLYSQFQWISTSTGLSTMLDSSQKMPTRQWLGIQQIRGSLKYWQIKVKCTPHPSAWSMTTASQNSRNTDRLSLHTLRKKSKKSFWTIYILFIKRTWLRNPTGEYSGVFLAFLDAFLAGNLNKISCSWCS